jgi:hypothetical protein
MIARIMQCSRRAASGINTELPGSQALLLHTMVIVDNDTEECPANDALSLHKTQKKEWVVMV